MMARYWLISLFIVGAISASAVSAQAQSTQTVRLATMGIELDVPTVGTFTYGPGTGPAGTVLIMDGAKQAAHLLVRPTGVCESAPTGAAPVPSLAARGYAMAARIQNSGGMTFYIGCRPQPGRWRAVMVAGTVGVGVTETQLFDVFDAMVGALAGARRIDVVRTTDAGGQTLTHADGWTLDLGRSPNNWEGDAMPSWIGVSRTGPIAGILKAKVTRVVDDIEDVIRCAPLAAAERPPGIAGLELRPGVFVAHRSGAGSARGTSWDPAWIEICAADAEARVYTLRVEAHERGVTELADAEIADLVAAFADLVLGPLTVATPTAPAPTPADPAPAVQVDSGDDDYDGGGRRVFRATYVGEYRRVGDPDRVNGLEGAIVASYIGYWGASDTWTSRIQGSLGLGLGGGVLYDFAWEAGVGFGAGPARVRLLIGLGYSGVTEGKIASGIGFPVAVEASTLFGDRFALTARAAAQFVPDEDSRGSGSERAPFGDELELFAGLRVLEKGWLLGVSHREQLSTSFTGFAVGITR